MLNLIQKLSLLFLFSLTLQAQTGLNQKHLISLSPEPSAQEISADTSIEVQYDLNISKHSLHKRAIVLTNVNHKKIKGKVSIKNANTLIFTPNEELGSGEYRVKVKKINLQDYTPNTRFKRFAKRFCSYFYDDVKECRLYRYASRVKTKPIKYSFSVDDNKPKIVRISLSKSNIQLNEDNTTTISVNAKYDDNTSIDITNSIEWIISNPNIISIDKNIITPIKEGTTTLQAKFNNQTTAEISLTVYKEINGYKLPPEPDPTINNSTLLGIDSNNNGVRDDVERWIFLEMEIYNGYEKIEQVIAMQEAKANQMAMIDPTNAYDKVHDVMKAALDCWAWYSHSKSLPFDDGMMKFSRILQDKSFNTKERLKTYWQYDSTLAGRVFSSTPTLKTKTQCEISIDEL